jgi:adenylate cyclase
LSVLADAGVFPHSGNRTDGRTDVQQDIQKFAEAALADSKREGLWLAVRARCVLAATLWRGPAIYNEEERS